MDVCSNCGTQNLSSARFCKSCGMQRVTSTGPLVQGPQNTGPFGTAQSGLNSRSLDGSYAPSPPPVPPIGEPAYQQHYYPAPLQSPVPYVTTGGASDVNRLMMFEANRKSTSTAILLCFFLGIWGVHRFYAGQSGSGAAMLIITAVSILLMFVIVGFLTIWITIIWQFVDLFLCSEMVRKYNNDLAARLSVRA